MFQGVPESLIPFGRFAKKVKMGEEPQRNKETILRVTGCRAVHSRNAQTFVSTVKRRLGWNKLATWARAVTI